MKLLTSLVFILALTSCSNEPAPKLSDTFIKATLVKTDTLIAKHFPLLKNVKLEVVGIRSAAVFLATDIKIPSLLSGKRDYVLYLNPVLETNPLSEEALTAILVHELAHFNDYQKMNIGELASFYFKILTNAEFNTSYERATDLQALKLGYSKGIKTFRKWLYPQLTKEDLAIKRKNYFTPNEIEQWLVRRT